MCWFFSSHHVLRFLDWKTYSVLEVWWTQMYLEIAWEGNECLQHLYGTVRYGLFGLKWSEFYRGLPPASHPPTLLEEKSGISSRDHYESLSNDDLGVPVRDNTRLHNQGQRAYVFVCMCIFWSKKIMCAACKAARSYSPHNPVFHYRSWGCSNQLRRWLKLLITN